MASTLARSTAGPVDLDLDRLGPGFGANVRGVDLATADDGTVAAVRQALTDHKVLFFAGQRLELTVVAAKPRSTAKSGKPAATHGAARKSSATQPVAKAPSKVTKTGTSHGKVVAATR